MYSDQFTQVQDTDPFTFAEKAFQERQPHSFRGSDDEGGAATIIEVPMDAAQTLTSVASLAALYAPELLNEISAILGSLTITAREQPIDGKDTAPFRLDDLTAVTYWATKVVFGVRDATLGTAVRDALKVIEPLLPKHDEDLTPEQEQALQAFFEKEFGLPEADAN